jgi:hypothetical protein
MARISLIFIVLLQLGTIPNDWRYKGTVRDLVMCNRFIETETRQMFIEVQCRIIKTSKSSPYYKYLRRVKVDCFEGLFRHRLKKNKSYNWIIGWVYIDKCKPMI